MIARGIDAVRAATVICERSASIYSCKFEVIILLISLLHRSPNKAKVIISGEAETSDESSLTTRLASRWTELMNNSDSEVGERVLVIHHDCTKLGVQLLRFDVEKLRQLESRLRDEAKRMKPYNSEQLTEQAVVAVYVDSAVVRGM